MKKHIKDYVQFYLGCEVLIQAEVGRKINLGLYYPEVWTNEGNLEPNGVEIFYPEIKKVYAMNFNQVKLILRPLSDIKEEEIIDLAKKHNDKAEWKFQDGKCIARINIGIQEHFFIEDGICFIQKIENNIFNQEGDGSRFQANIMTYELTRCLLSKGFDLFGLIADGLADEQTISQTISV